MSEILTAESIGKRYLVRAQRSLLVSLAKHDFGRQHWALRNVDFSLEEGEILAAIGRNGAGKSTLLKVASGVTTPTEGRLVRPKRIAPLIEVGAGFHPDLSGRENVEINGRLLGLTAKQVQDRFDDIVEFAELSHAIDQPIRQYSSGMFMRLGFAVAVHTEPELLAVDEVLAVGDLPFQMRCLERIRELREGGAAVLFVSHNLTAVAALADRAILLERGEVRARGTAQEVISAYHALLTTSTDEAGFGDEGASSGEVELESIALQDLSGAEAPAWEPGTATILTFDIRAAVDLDSETIVGYRIIKEGAGLVSGWEGTAGTRIPAMQQGERRTLQLALNLNLAEGSYLVDLAVARPNMTIVMLATGATRFGIIARPGGAGIADLQPELSVGQAK